MYFIIFVMSWYVMLWLTKHSVNLSNGLHYQQAHLKQGLWGILVHSIKGFTVGYTIWFIYYCISNYPYDLF